MNLEELVGQTLDNKYRIERELGRGGMGTVYLATHVGTERPVAVKVIAPQFMERQEFVERFRREARAAGRLRHPNVVNVTDFGLSETKLGRVAYLVMEYLDGCTLGEILEEEKKLPLSWSIDILEQISSAIEEAHRQGIIHRDLKPDNIWLEPNQRGGYTVKVLDFGIAKLEEHIAQNSEIPLLKNSGNATREFRKQETVAENGEAKTVADRQNSTAVSEAATMAFGNDTENLTDAENFIEPKTLIAEAGTLIQPNNLNLEGGTAIMPATPTTANQTSARLSAENVGTKLMSAPFETAKSEENESNKSVAETSPSSELTRVGAVLGTPLYMSPEQCRGEHLSPRSDIYSLAVVAYQMISGKTPFAGDFTEVMNAHKDAAPPALEAKKIPKKVKRIIHASLAKNPDERPQTAEAFASELRAQSEGIGILMQRALVIYTEHLPKFLGLAVLLFAPVIFINVLQITFRVLTLNQLPDNLIYAITYGGLSLVSAFCSFLCAYLLFGTVTRMVAQILAFPLRPVSVRTALQATRRKWKPQILTGLLSTFLTFLGLFPCFLGFPVLSVLLALVAPVVMMENLRGFAALKRSKNLVMRSLKTTTAATMIMFIIPITVSFLIAFMVKSAVSSVASIDEKTRATISRAQGKQAAEVSASVDNANGENAVAAEKFDKENRQVNINIGADKSVSIEDKNDAKDVNKSIRAVVKEALTQILLLPFSILMGSFSSILFALLYFKTRIIGGEPTQDLLAQLEDADEPQRNWQKRIRSRRVEQTGKPTSKS